MSPFLPPDPGVERRIRALGETLFTAMEAAPSLGVFSKKASYARVMEWSLRDPAFKTQLFRFVDVLPALKTNAEVVRHLQEYLGDNAVALNPALKLGLVASSFAPGLVAGPVRTNVAAMARQFVAGEGPADLVQQLRINVQRGFATTIDLLGESVVSEAEADRFLRRNLEVLDAVSVALAENPTGGFSDEGLNGLLPRLNLSVKISALTPEVHPADPKNSIFALKKRLRPILRRASALGAFINFDMESYKLKDLTLALFKSILEESEFQQQPAIGIALQAYLRDSERDLRELIAWARGARRPIGLRLVKGAYWDLETILARQRDWPVPVWSWKAETDANFEKLSRLLLENCDIVAPAFATHNVRSCAHAIAQAERLGITTPAYEFQTLFGMADELKCALVANGYRVREYCAIGELLPGMAYLVRRLLENTSNEGFVRLRNAGEATRDQLLTNPIERVTPAPVPASPPRKPRLDSSPPSARPFRNAPNTDFSVAANRDLQQSAIVALRSNLGRKVPLVIAGRKISDREFNSSVNPARPAEIVGYWARATVEDAEAAVRAGVAAFPRWRDTPVADRAAVLHRAADLLETRRFELNALEVLEAAKPWMEADADISEAIDCCRYYAEEMRLLDFPSTTQAVPGERCFQVYLPRGVGVAIAPWNFPLAILTGLTVAPLVAGNAVILKPAEQTTLIAAALMDILVEAGAPPGVINFLPGFGEDIGAHLVAHPQIDFIAFTGSRAVGQKIWETAAVCAPGQVNLKKVVCEMGGKNALIIDDDADLDEAIPAALYSAFGFSGQKCSALSRLVVLEGIYDDFVTRFISACGSVPMGDPSQPGSVVGPVIDGEAQKKISSLIEQGKREATLAFQAVIPPELAASGGYYVPLTVFVDVPAEAAIAQDEIFGPVLAIIRVTDLDHAFAVANGTEYALTGGIFSRSPRSLARAEQEFRVGNLYLNRGITGAIVQRHPFGGFKMSGGGTKAGGKGYLENFLFPRIIVENVMRRGFTPTSPGE